MPGLLTYQANLAQPAERVVLAEWVRRTHPDLNVLITTLVSAMRYMKEVKRFTSTSLSEVLGLEADAGSFLFKPADSRHGTYPEPHRKELFSLGLILQGTSELRVGVDSYLVRAPGLVAISPDEVRQWFLPSADSKIMSLFFAEDFAIAGLTDSLFIKNLPIYRSPGHHFLSLTPAELLVLTALFQQIEKKQQSADLNRLESIQAMLRVVLLEVLNVQALRRTYDASSHSQPQQLTARFKQLLAARISEHRTVGYYAQHLFVSPKHLSQTVKEQTGKTARELIEELLCLEAKILLQREELTVSQVSQQLNFANPSFFGKFFKRGAGRSPQQYRRQLAVPQADI